MKLAKMDALLKESLSPKKYIHSINVMHEATILAQYFGVNEKKAQIAGLLHDCGREVPVEKSPEEADKLGLKVLKLEREQPVLLHAPIGKIIAKEKYGIIDEEILKAISLHTTGDKNMTELDMVIFLADFIEPDRTQKGVDKVRQLARKDLRLAMFEALSHTMSYLSNSQKFIHPACIDCWNYFVAQGTKGK